jgi:hypothetical protein
MTGEKYLVCEECKTRVYVCKNGRLEDRPQQMNDIAAFVTDHQGWKCRGPITVWDECCVPFEYKDYFGKGRKP